MCTGPSDGFTHLGEKAWHCTSQEQTEMFLFFSQGVRWTAKMSRWSKWWPTESLMEEKVSKLWSWKFRRPSWGSWQPSYEATAPSCCPSRRHPLRRPQMLAHYLTSKVTEPVTYCRMVSLVCLFQRVPTTGSRAEQGHKSFWASTFTTFSLVLSESCYQVHLHICRIWLIVK